MCSKEKKEEEKNRQSEWGHVKSIPWEEDAELRCKSVTDLLMWSCLYFSVFACELAEDLHVSQKLQQKTEAYRENKL